MRYFVILAMLVGCDSPGDDASGDASATSTADATSVADGDVAIECPDGLTGPTCDSCTPGHVMNANGVCEAVVVDCVENPDICGAYGFCQFTEIGVDPDDGIPYQVFSECLCDPGHDGTYCEACADGFQANGALGVCRPDCANAGLACDAPKACDDSSGTARCVCPEGTTGATCELCALGWVASGDACVRGTPEVPEASCDEIAARGGCVHGICQNAACACETGWAGLRCDECAPGHEGDDCGSCANGWMRLADGPCRPSCHPNSDSCGPNGYCWDQETLVATCECEPGYVGPTCSTCDTGFVPNDDGECVAALGANERFFTIATFSDHQHLAVIDTSTGKVRPIHTLDFRYWTNSTYKLTWDSTRERIVMRAPETDQLNAFDPLTLAMTPIATGLKAAYMPAVAYDPARDRVLVMEDRTLVAVDPTNGTKANLTSLANLGSINELFVDVTNDRVVVGYFGQVAGTYFLVGVDLDTFEQTPLGETPDDLPIWDGNQAGFALDDDGALLMTSTKATTYADRRPIECRQEAFRLTGDAAYLTAPVRFLETGDGTTVVTSQQTSGPELVAAGDFFHEHSTIDIATTNPDIVICPPWYFFDDVTLRIAASARFRAMALPSSAVHLVVEAGFPTNVVRIFGYQGEAPVDASLVDNPIVQLYTDEEWAARRLGSSGFAGESWETNALRGGGWLRTDVTFASPVFHEAVGMDLMGLAGPR